VKEPNRPTGTPEENRAAWLALYPDWVITVTGRLLVGRLQRTTAQVFLSPVYDLLALPRPLPGGMLGTMHMVAPVLGLPSITELDITETRQARVSVEVLSANDLETIAGLLYSCEENLSQMPEARRVTETGLVTSGTADVEQAARMAKRFPRQ
jgi:hypothetical protein